MGRIRGTAAVHPQSSGRLAFRSKLSDVVEHRARMGLRRLDARLVDHLEHPGDVAAELFDDLHALDILLDLARVCAVHRVRRAGLCPLELRDLAG